MRTAPRRSLPERLRARLRWYRYRTENLVQRRWRRALAAASRDRTASMQARSCLVVAAHPDDETFGCGATIARKSSMGAPVKVFIACDGRNANPASQAMSPEALGALRRKEAVEACQRLGVPAEHVIQPGVAHLRSAEAVDEVTRLLSEVIDEFSPSEILVNSALDYHPDHKILNRILRRLVAERKNRAWIAEYPVWYLFDGPWSPDRQALAGRPTIDEQAVVNRGRVSAMWYRLTEPVVSVLRLRPWKVATGRYLEAKRQAVATYRSQVTNFTGEETWGFLGPDFIDVFLQPEEMFFPLRALGRPWDVSG